MTAGKLIALELITAVRDKAVLITVCGGMLFYFFLYPLPYLQQTPRDLNVVVVDMDNSQLSRQLARMIDATPQVHIAARSGTIEEAETLSVTENMAGILVIPEHFHRDLMLNKRPTLSYAGNAGLFLVFSTAVEGMLGAGQTLAATAKISRLVKSGTPMVLAGTQHQMTSLNNTPVFNEVNGYINYVVPAIFVLIIHHILAIGSGLICAAENEARRSGIHGYWEEVHPVKLLVVRVGVFTSAFLVISLAYLGYGLEFYHIPRQANGMEILLLLLPLLTGACLFGISIGALVPKRELVTLIILLTSMPVVFSAGFVWPEVAIPHPILRVMNMIPAIPAIKAFLELNQMGSGFANILPLLKQMWLCTGLYFVICLILFTARRNFLDHREIPQAPEVMPSDSRDGHSGAK